MDNFRLSQLTDTSMAQRAEHQIQMAEVLGSVLNRVTFLLGVLFHMVKPLMPKLPLVLILCL